MKKLVLAAALLGSLSAQAIENTFEFTVESSGPDMYACNAGIKHKDRNGSAGWGAGDSQTNTTNPGDYLQDVMEASWGSYDQWTETYTELGIGVKLRANGSNNFNTLFGESMGASAFRRHRDSDDNAVVLSALRFELSSERYGSEYFVDVCYYGPRFHSGPVGTHFVTEGEVTVTNTYDRTYLEKAGLQVKATLKCDGDVKVATEWEDLTSGSLKSLWNGLSLGGNAPRKCVARYHFRESLRGQRVNQEHGAEVRVRTEIVDPNS